MVKRFARTSIRHKRLFSTYSIVIIRMMELRRLRLLHELSRRGTVASVAQAHGKTPAQALIRWSIQLGNVVIPRSANPERITSNIDVFDFELSDDEMAALNALDDGTRFRPDPETYTGT